MWRKISLLGIGLVASVMMGGGVMGAASLNGPSGLILMPTAESLSYMQSELAVDYRFVGEAQSHSIKYNIGIAKNLELGIFGGTVPAEGYFINAKYFLVADAQRLPLSLALGVQNVGSKTESSVYMVVSKRLDPSFGVHGGFMGVFTPTEVRPEMMAGLEYMMNEKVSVVADAMTVNKKVWVNAGVRIEVLPALLLRASVLDLTKASDTSTMTSVGASYTIFL